MGVCVKPNGGMCQIQWGHVSNPIGACVKPNRGKCQTQTQSVKLRLQKFNITILKIVTCLGFSNFGCFWCIFVIVKPTCCTYQNLCMTLRIILDFL